MITVSKKFEKCIIKMATKTMRGKTQLTDKELKDWTQDELKFYIERTLQNPRNYKTLESLFDHSVDELRELVKDAAPKVKKPKIKKEDKED
jgi:hypothetical protein